MFLKFRVYNLEFLSFTPSLRSRHSPKEKVKKMTSKRPKKRKKESSFIQG